MKNNWDHNVSRKIKSEYEEAKYPLPNIDMEWEKFSSQLPESGKAKINPLEIIGFFSMVVICVAVCLLTGNKLNKDNRVQKENIKTTQQDIISNQVEKMQGSALQTEKHGTAIKENSGVEEEQVSEIKRSNTGEVKKAVPVYAGARNNNHLSTDKTTLEIAVANESLNRKGIELPDGNKTEVKNSEETEQPEITGAVKADSTGFSEQVKAAGKSGDSAVKNIKPNNRSTILRLELYLNGANARTSVKTIGGGLMAGIQYGRTGISSGIFVDNGYNDLRYMGVKTRKIYRIDSVSNYIYTDSLNAVSSSNLWFHIPVEFSCKLSNRWQAYTRVNGGISFRQNYKVDHLTNLRDSAVSPAVMGELNKDEQYKGNLKGVATSLGIQLGMRYTYKKFSLGVAGSLPLYNNSIVLLEKHFEQEGFRIGQRPQNSIFYTFSLGYNF